MFNQYKNKETGDNLITPRFGMQKLKPFKSGKQRNPRTPILMPNSLISALALKI
jgi:hypothetical protein